MEKYTIGIDAGGTHSTAVVRQGGKELFRAGSGAMNGNAAPWEQVEENLCDLLVKIEAAGYEKALCGGIGIGIAGISNPMTRTVMEKGVRCSGYTCPLKVVSDGESALWGAVPRGRGILLIAGTGCIAYGRKTDGTVLRCGGYGHLIDDKGSAYDAGIQILTQVVQAHDGRRLATPLTRAVMEFWGISTIEELIARVYSKDTGKKEIAQLSLLMAREELVATGCFETIQQNLVDSWMELVRTIAGKLDGDGVLVGSGSLLTKNRQLIDRFREALEALPGITLAPAQMDAANGAAELVREEA